MEVTGAGGVVRVDTGLVTYMYDGITPQCGRSMVQVVLSYGISHSEYRQIVCLYPDVRCHYWRDVNYWFRFWY